MPIRGIIFIAVVGLVIAVLQREQIFNWLTHEFGVEERANENEKENEK